MNDSLVYLDHAATTPIRPEVVQAMLPWLTEHFGNPSSFHMQGKIAKDALDDARAEAAKFVGARPEEIIFTAGGTEANNLAILGFARANAAHGKHLITTVVEHHATLAAMEHLEKKEGFSVTYLPVDKYGQVTVEQVEAAVKEDTILVSVMFANNEIGTIQPIAEIGRMLEKKRGTKAAPRFHVDACQAAGALDLNVIKNHVDMMSVNASKVYGPKGVGMLYLKSGIKVQPLMFGGYQERGLRPGTENVAGIIGFAKALTLAAQERDAEVARLTQLRDMLIKGIQKAIPKTRLNGHPTMRLPNNVNISILDIEGEAMVLYLDAKGIYAATGSACTSTSLDPSHVILATGLPYEVAHGSLRFTLGKTTTQEDIQKVLKELPPLVEKLRAMSPVCLPESILQN